METQPSTVNVEDSPLHIVRLDAAAVAGYPDLLPRAHDGDVDLIIISGLYEPAELAPIVQRLEAGETPFPMVELPPDGAGRLFGYVLDLVGTDVEGYLEQAGPFRENCRALFSPSADFEERMVEVVEPMATGRKLEVLRSADDRDYLAVSIRNLRPGGFIWMHCEDQKLVEPAKRRIHEVAVPHVSSFYMALAPAQTGGKLVLYDLTWDTIQERQLIDGRCDPSVITRECAAYSYTPRAGEMVIFGKGRVHEILPVGPGSERWTIGGFFTLSQDGERVLYLQLMRPTSNGARRIALVCMTPVTDANETGNMEMPSYGVKRILAAVAADPELQDAEFAFIDLRRNDIEGYVDAIVNFEADLIGFSIYIWSSLLLTDVARRVKQRCPDSTIVFGGPSVRTALFDLPPYASPVSYLDAVVESEGELTFCEVARQPELNRSVLSSVGGLDLPTADGWENTGPRTPIANLDQIASPFQLGLMPDHSVAYLETYRGCPMSCAFCEWGRADNPGTVFSQDYIAAELAAYAAADVPAVFLVDAGLNLNAKAFKNLAAAERQVEFLKTAGFWCEVYPSLMKDEQMEFLGAVGRSAYWA